MQFDAQKTEPNVILSWKTANEVDVSRFEVERSLNGTEFSIISAIPAKNQQAATYTYTDEGVMISSGHSATLYYRLKMIDRDGKFTYSGIVVIRNNQKLADVRVVPNPFKDRLQVQLQTSVTSTLRISLRDLTGKLVEAITKEVGVGSTVVNLSNATNLQQGIYIVEVECNGMRQYFKVIK